MYKILHIKTNETSIIFEEALTTIANDTRFDLVTYDKPDTNWEGIEHEYDATLIFAKNKTFADHHFQKHVTLHTPCLYAIENSVELNKKHFIDGIYYISENAIPDTLEQLIQNYSVLKGIHSNKATFRSNTFYVKQSKEKKLQLRKGGTTILLNMNEVSHIKILKRGSEFHLVNQDVHISTRSIEEILSEKFCANLLKINAYQVINVAHAARYRKGDGGTIEMSNGTELNVTRQNKSLLLNMLNINYNMSDLKNTT